jgi:hypothetical protein
VSKELSSDEPRNRPWPNAEEGDIDEGGQDEEDADAFVFRVLEEVLRDRDHDGHHQHAADAGLEWILESCILARLTRGPITI